MPKDRTLRLAALAWACFFALVPGSVGAADPQKEIEELRKRVSALETRLELMELFVKELKQEVNRLRAGGSVASIDPAPEARTPKTGPVPQVPAVQEGPRVSKEYGSAIDMMRDLPPSLQPVSGKGWDAAKLNEVKEWMRRSMNGHRFRGAMEVSRVQLARNPKGFEEGQAPWHVTFFFEPQRMEYEGAVLMQKVSDLWPQPLLIAGSEEYARAASQVGRGTKVVVKGEVVAVTLGALVGEHRDCVIQLRGYAVDAPQFKPREPAAP